MTHHSLLILRQLERLDDEIITLDDLCRRKSYRNTCILRMILDQMHDRVNASVNSAAVIVFTAEIGSSGSLLILCNVDRVLNQLMRTFVPQRRYRNDRNPQFLFHLINTDRAAVPLQLIHHVQREHDWNVQLQKLHRQIKIPFDICRVHDIYDAGRLFIQNKLT